MNLSFMQNEIVLALCWTLIHSLWQGLLLATLTGAVMIGTRKSNARKRYGLLTFLFFVFIAVAAVTFVKEYRSFRTDTALVQSVPVSQVSAPLISDLPSPVVNEHTLSQSWQDRFKDYFNTHASLIVMIWFVIFIARFIRLTANLAYVQRLKHYKTCAPPLLWKDKMDELVRTIGIKKPVRLLESGIVKVPVVMGVLKPVILLPLGLLAHLPADEIEAILLHELAHIKRRDYFMNLLQSFAETVFFFNPALMWLSSVIREERENCCDDIAISITNSKTKFINALIAFQEYHFTTPSYTVGFPGRKNQLLNRVKRIVNERNKTLNTTEKSVLTFGMGVFILLSFAAAKKITPVVPEPLRVSAEDRRPDENRFENKQAFAIDYTSPKKPVTAREAIVNDFNDFARSSYLNSAPEYVDTTPHKIPGRTNSGRSVFLEEKSVPLTLKTYSAVADSLSNLFTGMTVNHKSDDGNDIEYISATRKDGTLYNFTKVNGRLTELSVDNKAVNAADLVKYDAVIADIENVLQYRRQRTQERRELAAADRQVRLFDKQAKLFDNQLKLNEKRLIAKETQRIIADQKHEILLHNKAQHDQDLKLKQRELLLNKNKLKITEKTELDLLRKSQDRIKLGLKMKTDTANLLKRDKVHVLQSDMIRLSDKQKTVDTVSISKKDGFTTVSGDRLKLTSGGKDGYTVYSDVIRYKDLVDLDVIPTRKQEAMRARAAEDEARVQVSAEIMRNIIKDLEADGIAFNMQTGWFALDKDQFVVDGKNIPASLHEKFRNKYIKPKDGWGYYYGPIKVTGRGIFLDYKNLVR